VNTFLSLVFLFFFFFPAGICPFPISSSACRVPTCRVVPPLFVHPSRRLYPSLCHEPAFFFRSPPEHRFRGIRSSSAGQVLFSISDWSRSRFFPIRLPRRSVVPPPLNPTFFLFFFAEADLGRTCRCLMAFANPVADDFFPFQQCFVPFPAERESYLFFLLPLYFFVFSEIYFFRLLPPGYRKGI